MYDLHDILVFVIVVCKKKQIGMSDITNLDQIAMTYY